MLEGKWGAKGSVEKGFEEFMGNVGPEAYNGVVVRRYITEGGGDGRH